MQRCEPSLFVALSGLLELLAISPATKDMVLTDDYRTKATAVLRDSSEQCLALGLTISLITINKMLTLLSEAGATDGELRPLARELQGRIVDEMRGEVFFWLTSREAERYELWWKDWEGIMKRFPETMRDIEEMNKCFALCRYTASMFHSLHVAEWGAIKLGDYIGVTDSKKAWGPTERKLSELIKGGHANLPATLSGTFEFLEQMNRQIDSMVLAWRHKVDHAVNHLAIVPNADFTPDVAGHIIGAVRVFMLRLLEGMPIDGV
jgi:hypothetical protein